MPERSMRHGAVLLVDDDADTVESVKRTLETYLDVQVNTARSGEDALLQLRDRPVHVILSDLRMPGMDGEAFLREAQRIYPSVQLLLMTGQGARSEDPRRGPVATLLAKPLDPVLLIDAIRGRLPALA